MEKTQLIFVMVLLVFLGAVNFAEAQSHQQQGNRPTYNQGPTYNYHQHSQDSYNRSIQNYQNNPTQQNYQVMQQRERVYDIRQQQYQRNNWSPKGNSSVRR
jgi:hypothetical protein